MSDPKIEDGFLIMRDRKTHTLTLAIDLETVSWISRNGPDLVLRSGNHGDHRINISELPDETINQIVYAWGKARRGLAVPA